MQQKDTPGWTVDTTEESAKMLMQEKVLLLVKQILYLGNRNTAIILPRL